MLNFRCQGPSISTFSKHPNLSPPISINFEFLIFRSSISTTSSATSSSTGSHWTSNSANKLSKVLQYISYKIYMMRHCDSISRILASVCCQTDKSNYLAQLGRRLRESCRSLKPRPVRNEKKRESAQLDVHI